ncbi:MAG TPA: hypothetical protein VJX30_07715 [Terriglobales bacterium]|nr:hypothetical protein [Terriglobales bacterium]
MKTNLTRCFAAIALSAGLAIPATLFAQAGQDSGHPTHHHYKLIDLGTFGGPKSNMNQGGDNGSWSDAIGNNQGTFTGWADTPRPDPLIDNPNFCFVGDCYVTHAFQWQNGVRKDLGVLPGGASSATAWISANGLIAGTSQNGETDPLFSPWIQERAVLWQNGKIVNLGTLPEGGYESGAAAVNNSGQVTGWAINTIPDPYSFGAVSPNFFQYHFYGPYQTRAFLWQNGVMRDLGTLGGPDAFPTAINELGQVTGFSYTSSTTNSNNGYYAVTLSNTPVQDPFFWDKDTGMIDIGTLGGTCGGPSGLNNRGQIVGASNLAGDQVTDAFLWDRARGLIDLGTLGGSSAEASAINDAGVVVGGSLLSGDVVGHAFLWDGKMHDLGAIPGDNYAYPFWINASGQVVGNGGNDSVGHGFLWEGAGPIVDLDTLISSNNGFSITEAAYINDQGEIIGLGAPAGCDDTDTCGHDYLLIPCDEKHPGLEGCDYDLVDATAAPQLPEPRYVSRETQPTPQSRRANRYRISGLLPLRGRSAN